MLIALIFRQLFTGIFNIFIYMFKNYQFFVIKEILLSC